MSCLLDTHAFLSEVFAPNKLSARARKKIHSAKNRICLSTVSFWEISLKYAMGKIEYKKLPARRSAQETASFHRLPKYKHKDPLDRMIVWQAIQQPLVLISKDGDFPECKEFGLKNDMVSSIKLMV